jgi:hypothetical protein
VWMQSYHPREFRRIAAPIQLLDLHRQYARTYRRNVW